MQNKRIIFLVFIFLIFFLSTESPNFFYEIVTDFHVMFDNHFLVYYRYYEQVKQRFFIYGYDLSSDKGYGFSPSSEFATTKPFMNIDNSAFAYGALYQGNDFVWYKDYKNKVAYKILYSISGKLSLLSLDRAGKEIIVGFDYLAPQQFLYISGVKEFYTYPLTSYPNIIDTGFTPDEKNIYLIYKYNNAFFCDILPLAPDPFNASSYKPIVKKIFSNAERIICKNYKGIVTKENEGFFYYDLKEYTKRKINDLVLINDKNTENDFLLLMDGKVYNKNFEEISISTKNFLSQNFNAEQLYKILKIDKNIFYSQGYLALMDDSKNIFIFQFFENQKSLELIGIINASVKGIESIDINRIYLISNYQNKFYFLVENLAFNYKSFSILSYSDGSKVIESIYSDNIFSLKKGLILDSGFAILIKKQYTKGIFQELFYFSFINKSMIKISGFENVSENELSLLARKVE